VQPIVVTIRLTFFAFAVVLLTLSGPAAGQQPKSEQPNAAAQPVVMELKGGDAPPAESQTTPKEIAPPAIGPAAQVVIAAARPNAKAKQQRLQTSKGNEHYLSKYKVLDKGVVPAALAAGAPAEAKAEVPLLAQAEAKLTVDKPTKLEPSVTSGMTSNVSEPTVAISKRGERLYTANWFAAFAKAGEDLTHMDPESLPESGIPGVGFCCDQVALYAEETAPGKDDDLMIWFLQYTQNGRENMIRVAVAKGADIATRKWRLYDFTPKGLGGWTNEWFDFPELALGKGHLFITVNSFATKGTANSGDDEFARAVILRLPLADLREYKAVTPRVFSTTKSFSLRPTQGATKGAMYFGSHDPEALGERIEVYTWPDNATTLSRNSIKVDSWNASSLHGYRTTNKDGTAWLKRTDTRVTAAWMSGSQIGFGWSVDKNSETGKMKHPHVRMAVFNVAMTGAQPGQPSGVASQPHLFNEKFAFAYPAVGVTASGKVGLAVCVGGGFHPPGSLGVRNPGVAVGYLEPPASGSTEPTWKLADATPEPTPPVPTHLERNGPSDGLWGDYLAVRPNVQKGGDAFIASGFILEGGGDTTNVVPLVLTFNLGAGGGGSDTVTTKPTLEEIKAQAEKVQTELNKLKDMIKAAGGM
jgi:hypothetical protein